GGGRGAGAHPHLARVRWGDFGRAGPGVVRAPGSRCSRADAGLARRGGRGVRGGHPVNETLVRADGRAAADLRPLKVQMGYLEWAEGSALLEMGKTVVL